MNIISWDINCKLGVYVIYNSYASHVYEVSHYTDYIIRFKFNARKAKIIEFNVLKMYDREGGQSVSQSYFLHHSVALLPSHRM